MTASPIASQAPAPVPADQRHLIALDLDGTVLDHDFVGSTDNGGGSDGGSGFSSDGHIDPELAAAIRALHEAGHEVIVSTGRSVDATLPIVERLRIRPTWIVAANGAVTLRRDPLAHRAYRREYVEAFDPSDALVRLRTQLVTARFAVELADGGFLYTEPIPAGTLPSKQRQVPFEQLLGVQASRVVVVSPDHRLEEFLDAVRSVGLTHVSYAVGSTAWLDIAPDGVTKASALEVLAERLGIDASRFFAAGDGRNDIAMLKWAGRRGDAVAMGQAVPEVQAAASRVTGTIEENGLLTALRDRFPAVLMPRC
ncbi:MAG: HAD family hydrolase [Leucobacter sp.]